MIVYISHNQVRTYSGLFVLDNATDQKMWRSHWYCEASVAFSKWRRARTYARLHSHRGCRARGGNALRRQNQCEASRGRRSVMPKLSRRVWRDELDRCLTLLILAAVLCRCCRLWWTTAAAVLYATQDVDLVCVDPQAAVVVQYSLVQSTCMACGPSLAGAQTENRRN